MTQPLRIHLFQGFGVELEYMIVDRDTLALRSITDELLKHELGSYQSDFENGMVTWSNELVLHVVELKSTRPESNFHALELAFADNIHRINANLKQWNAMLLPTAAHPWMNPATETRLWPHENNEVYEIYNRIFDCKGHGWSNLQSTHLNLPFYDDEEFAKLHAAVRVILPILPALCASSPILEGNYTGLLDTRLKYYKTNQSKIPSITGRVIPEAVFSKRNYLNTIYEKIKSDVAPYDPEGVLNPVWVNSRGAIPRFDRGSIEIRVMDVQECPTADLAIVNLVIETLRVLVKGQIMDMEQQMRLKTESLAAVFEQCYTLAEGAMITDGEYLRAWGIAAPLPARDVWMHIRERLAAWSPDTLQKWKPELDHVYREGTLATRIRKAVGERVTPARLTEVYRQLAGCLDQNKMFLP